jgi:hypothetical protein
MNKQQLAKLERTFVRFSPAAIRLDQDTGNAPSPVDGKWYIVSVNQEGVCVINSQRYYLTLVYDHIMDFFSDLNSEEVQGALVLNSQVYMRGDYIWETPLMEQPEPS